MRRFEKRQVGKRWTAALLRKYHRLMRAKTSIVFFEFEERPGAIGTQNVVLTPGRSLAVDRAWVPLSTPVWVETRVPAQAGQAPTAWQRLLVAQDTGGAIRGPSRGDIFFGWSKAARAIGARVNSPGRMWLLLPKALDNRAASADEDPTSSDSTGKRRING